MDMSLVEKYPRLGGWAILGSLVFMLLQGPALAQSTLDTLTFEKKEKLAKAGDDEAQFAIARAYEEGREGQRKDVLKAAQWYRKAAQIGNLDAQFRLARIVHNGADGVKKSPETAVKLYEAAAEAGHLESEYWTAYSYEKGSGVAPDQGKAAEWYR